MWNWAEDVLPLAGFATALVIMLTVPVRPGGTFNRTAKGFFAASILCYFISTLASIMGHVNLFPAFLEPAVSSVELLWVPFIVFGVYALYAHQQLTDAASSQHAVKKAGEMLESVMETAPAGIVVLNDAGAITFANGEARRLLDIADDKPSSLMSPDWSVRVADEHDDGVPASHDFHGLIAPEPKHSTPVLVSWPNGWHRHLVVNTAPFEDAAGRVGGAVAAFIEREPWSPGAAR
jgi:PAS domain-containing protein